MPLVSIISPARDASATIGDTILSVQSQSLTDWEMIIVDDGSSDGTGAIVEQFAAEDGRIRLVQRSTSSPGFAVARNRAIGAANGQFFAFLDAGDLWLSEKLHKQIAFMRERQAGISATAYRRLFPDGQTGRLLKGPARATFDTLLKRDCIATSAVIIDRSRIGPFLMRENFAQCDDLALWLSLTKQGHDIAFLNEDLARLRVMPRANRLRETWMAYSSVAKLTPVQTATALFCTTLHAFWRKLF